MSENDLPASRRRLLKSVATGGSALGLTALPGKWAKPMVASVVLPAHAQTSALGGCALSLANCPPESLVTIPIDSISTSKYYSSNSLPSGISENSNGFFEGTSSMPATGFPDGPDDLPPFCPPPCDDLAPAKYYSGQIAFDGTGDLSMEVDMQLLCGNDAIANINIEFSGEYDGSEDNRRSYAGYLGVNFAACYPGEAPKYPEPPEYIESGNPVGRASSRGSFRFGDQIRNQIRDRIRNRIGK